MKPKLLIINRAQFGYHTDTYYYCLHSRSQFLITYLCFNHHKSEYTVKDINIIYISRSGFMLRRFFRFLIKSLQEISNNHDVVFVKYFTGCSFLKLLSSHRKIICDIRTGFVNKNSMIRSLLNFILRLESMTFKYLSVISSQLASYLRIPKKKTYVIPLGAEYIDLPTKHFDHFHLLYVGTFEGRNLVDTLIGFKKFALSKKDYSDLHYYMIGDGYSGQLQEMKNYVIANGLSEMVSLPGYVKHDDLIHYYLRTNIGVSYVPINSIYDLQPPTKTYEYLIAGMPVIATATKANRVIVNHTNGILIDDTPESFYRGLEELFNRRQEFQSTSIKNTAEDYTWTKIVHGIFIPYLKTVIDNSYEL